MADSAALTVRDRLDGRVRAPRVKESLSPEYDAVLREARERWNRCDEAEQAQRTSILEAKKFRAGNQWPEAIRIAREGAQALQGQAAQPSRPCLTIDRLSQPVRMVSNQIKAAEFAIDVLPNGFGADDETAKIIKGHFRHIQNKARGESPIEWAADGSIEGGLGWFRIRTDYVDEAPDRPDESVFWQELRLERITNNLTVYCDPSSLLPTRSNAQFMFVTEDISKDEFRRRWPDADVTGIEDFCATGDMKGWDGKDNLRIAEYWRIRYQDEFWIVGRTGPEKVASFPKEAPASQCRTVRRPMVEGFKITAIEILERWDWLGSRIPLIPILGEELNVDGKPVLRGVIQEGMDAQRMLNYAYTDAIEDVALGIKAKAMVPAEGLKGHEQFWQNANKYNYSHLPYNQFDEMGRPINPPTVPPIHTGLAEKIQLMSLSEDGIKATTGVYAESLGETDPRHKSGTAIQSLQGQSDISNSNYANNVSRALIYAGELMVELLPKITTPGQILQILGMDDKPEQVMIGQPFQPGQKGQGPQPAMAQFPAGPVPVSGPNDPLFQKGLHKFYDLNAGRYAVTVSVGKASATKREEGAAALGALLPHLPPEQQMVIIPDYVEQMSFPGAHGIAEKLRRTLPPQLQDQEAGGPDPRVQALQQQIQQLQQALQSKVAEKQAEAQAKGQIDLAKTQLSEQAQTARSTQSDQVALQKAEIAAAASMANAQSKVDAENFRSYVDALENRLNKSLDLHMQAISDHVGKLHEAFTQGTQHAHEATQNALDRQQQASLAAQQHQQALEAQANQAALTPQPTDNGQGNA